MTTSYTPHPSWTCWTYWQELRLDRLVKYNGPGDFLYRSYFTFDGGTPKCYPAIWHTAARGDYVDASIRCPACGGDTCISSREGWLEEWEPRLFLYADRNGNELGVEGWLQLTHLCRHLDAPPAPTHVPALLSLWIRVVLEPVSEKLGVPKGAFKAYADPYEMHSVCSTSDPNKEA
jgi:hypothetical protein